MPGARASTRHGWPRSWAATGWLGRRQREWFETQLQSEGVAQDFVWVEADTRVCLNILNGDGLKTEIVEAGTPLPVNASAQLVDKVMTPYG